MLRSIRIGIAREAIQEGDMVSVISEPGSVYKTKRDEQLTGESFELVKQGLQQSKLACNELLGRITLAMEYAADYGSTDGGHHKMWVIDQMVRALTGCSIEKVKAMDCNDQSYEYDTQGKSEEYIKFVTEHNDGENGLNTYEWDKGIAP